MAQTAALRSEQRSWAMQQTLQFSQKSGGSLSSLSVSALCGRSLRSASTHTDFQKDSTNFRSWWFHLLKRWNRKALVNLRGRGWGALKKREAVQSKPAFLDNLAPRNGKAVARLLGMAWKAPLKVWPFHADLALQFVRKQAAGFSIDQWGFPEMLAAVGARESANLGHNPCVLRLSCPDPCSSCAARHQDLVRGD